MKVYYVYELCYPNGIPFYVGKGKVVEYSQKNIKEKCQPRKRGTYLPINIEKIYHWLWLGKEITDTGPNNL